MFGQTDEASARQMQPTEAPAGQARATEAPAGHPQATEAPVDQIQITDAIGDRTRPASPSTVKAGEVFADRMRSASPSMSKAIASKVLLIYTGGTIGMCNHKTMGYSPRAGFLYESLAQNPIFHDPHYRPERRPKCHSDPQLKPALTMPLSFFGKRVQYQILEYTPLLDSSNMTNDDWTHIAADIERFYHHFDSFVLLHGTDTMSYTASALSFLLENLGKTVILTGSQIPLSELRNDGQGNLLGALTLAGHYVIPEVALYFGNKLFRGNRTSKSNLSDFEAFESPNMKPLAHIGINIEVDWSAIWRSHEVKPFKASKHMDPNVACLRLFPGITEATVRAVLAPSVKGVVLETFGAGNAPDNRPDLLDALKAACDAGVVIVNISQCRTGIVSDIYATGKALSNAGVVPGMDMTTECALTKLSYLLGIEGLTPHEIREYMGQSIRGELSKPKYHHVNLTTGRTESVLGDSYTQLMQKLPSSMRNQFGTMFASHFLHMAAAENDVPGIDRILKLSADTANIDSLDYLDKTPIMAAVGRGAVDAVHHLLKLGVSVHIKDYAGKSALSIAREMTEEPHDVFDRIAHLLVEAGADSSL